MWLFNKLSLVLILSMSIGFPLGSYAGEDIEDQIYIAESDGKVTAIIAGVQSNALRLKPDENVLWIDTSGNLGAVLTNSGFYVISKSSRVWKSVRLSSNEMEYAKASLSPFIALLATDDRAIAYNISTDSFYETRLPIQEQKLAVKSGDNVAVVVMSSKLLGVNSISSSFIETRLKINEVFKDARVTENNVTVRTSDRLFTFTSKDFEWKMTKFD